MPAVVASKKNKNKTYFVAKFTKKPHDSMYTLFITMHITPKSKFQWALGGISLSLPPANVLPVGKEPDAEKTPTINTDPLPIEPPAKRRKLNPNLETRPITNLFDVHSDLAFPNSTSNMDLNARSILGESTNHNIKRTSLSLYMDANDPSESTDEIGFYDPIMDSTASLKSGSAATSNVQNVESKLPLKIKTMGDVKKFLEMYVRHQAVSNTFIGMKEMCGLLGVDTARGGTLKNYLKFAKCLERFNNLRLTAAGGNKSAAVLLGFKAERESMKFSDYVKQIKVSGAGGVETAAYSNWTALIRDKENNLGDSYTPDMTLIDLDKLN